MCACSRSHVTEREITDLPLPGSYALRAETGTMSCRQCKWTTTTTCTLFFVERKWQPTETLPYSFFIKTITKHPYSFFIATTRVFPRRPSQTTATKNKFIFRRDMSGLESLTVYHEITPIIAKKAMEHGGEPELYVFEFGSTALGFMGSGCLCSPKGDDYRVATCLVDTDTKDITVVFRNVARTRRRTERASTVRRSSGGRTPRPEVLERIERRKKQKK
jgi:hypothetical protein